MQRFQHGLRRRRRRRRSWPTLIPPLPRLMSPETSACLTTTTLTHLTVRSTTTTTTTTRASPLSGPRRPRRRPHATALSTCRCISAPPRHRLTPFAIAPSIVPPRPLRLLLLLPFLFRRRRQSRRESLRPPSSECPSSGNRCRQRLRSTP